jgi:hypothetical protein
MKIKYVWLLVAVFVLLAGPLTALAQDGEDKEMQEFVSEDGLLTLQYPVDWSADQDETLPFPMVMIGNSEELLERSVEDEDLMEGDAGIRVVILPVDVLAMFGAELPEDYELSDVALAVQASFSSDEEDGMEWGEPETISLTVNAAKEVVVEIISMTATDDTGEGVYYVYEADGLILIVTAAAYPGEFTEELAVLAQDVMATVDYKSTAEELLNAIMNPPEEEEEESEVAPTAAPVGLPTFTPVATATGNYPTYSEVLATLPADAELVTTDTTIDSVVTDANGTVMAYGGAAIETCGADIYRCYGAKFTLVADAVMNGVFYPAGTLFTIDVDHNFVPVSSWD